ncbi:MAG: protein-L-isoaspartate(D-aspartate) O-methyltransferase [Pseudomonadota bacterium]
MHPAAAARAGLPTAAARNKLADDLRLQGIKDERVLAVIARVPRHEFVEPAFQSQAYKSDLTVPIGHAQTLSQARVVAVMTEALLAGGKPARVLEVGTGSGYQTAVLAALCSTVFTVERIKALSETARVRLGALGIKNVHFGYADGTAGWASFAPFDAILVTAGADAVPSALIEQLAPGGRLVIPVGPSNAQVLQVITREANGSTTTLKVAKVSFVPLLAGRQ